jgi:hypothetical protein
MTGAGEPRGSSLRGRLADVHRPLDRTAITLNRRSLVAAILGVEFAAPDGVVFPGLLEARRRAIKTQAHSSSS